MNAHSARADSGNWMPPTAPCTFSSLSPVLLSQTDSPSTSPCNTFTCTPSITSLAARGAPCMSSSLPSSLLVTYNSTGGHTVTRADTAHAPITHHPSMILWWSIHTKLCIMQGNASTFLHKYNWNFGQLLMKLRLIPFISQTTNNMINASKIIFTEKSESFSKIGMSNNDRKKTEFT